MGDLETGLVVLGTAIGSKEIVVKLLGPTADYLGEGLKNWTEKSVHNVGRIFSNAKAKLGDRIDQPGTVPPRVLKGILQEGAFCDDELAGEYFGGVLASSRSEVSRDDRGASFISLISRLTTYQTRAHYIFYHIFKNVFDDTFEVPNLGSNKLRQKMQIFIPNDVYSQSMDFSKKEDGYTTILPHIMFGLSREDLIGPFSYGNIHDQLPEWIKPRQPGIIVQPSLIGVELFLWAYGVAEVTQFNYLNSDLQFPLTSGVTILSGSTRLSKE